MSLTLIKPSKDSIAIAYMQEPGKSDLYVYIDPNKDNIKKMVITDLTQKYVATPYIEKGQRCAVYISGPGGSGKSFWTAMFIKEIQKLKKYKSYPVYLFCGSSLIDPAFENIKNLNTINIYDDNLFRLTMEEFKECIVLYDDYESITDKNIKNFLDALLKSLLELSRKQHTIILTINHMTTNYNQTRHTIFESDTFCLFPSANMNSVLKFLKNYMDFTKEQLEDIKSLKTRAIVVRKNAPRYLISEKQIWLL